MVRAPCCEKTGLKRGPWTQEEDDILVDYINKNGGPGNWRSLPKLAGWKIKADYSKISVSRGRKKSSRIRNEMDIRHLEEPKRCGICRQVGHNWSRCTNSQPRYNSM